MSSKIINFFVERLLKNSLMFELQQKIFNDYDKVEDEFSDYLSKDNIKILDVGCSTGTAAANIFDLSKTDYIGIDISDEYISLARNKYGYDKFINMDATQMKFDSETFDIVLFNGVMHHMSDKLICDCLKEVRRVLKPNGYILIGEPVFTKSMPISTFFLNHDRGKFIRDTEGYKNLIREFKLERERYFRFSTHRFLSLVLKK
tara:strand:- start:1546 stop:2154 length:609 start_codon:yes stop_codon:yes gene_type:complete